jgi:hypothetical protein
MSRREGARCLRVWNRRLHRTGRCRMSLFRPGLAHVKVGVQLVPVGSHRSHRREDPAVTLIRTGVGLSGLLAAAAVVVAGATLWLVLTDPAAVAGAVSDQGMWALVGAVADVVASALREVARWL